MPKTLLVTGSNRGTGRAIAQTFCTEGYRVASLNKTLAHEDWLGEIQCDVMNPDELASGYAEALHYLSKIDVCVLNAAIRRFAYIEQMGDKDWDDSLATNLSSIFRLVRMAIPALRESQGALIIMGSHAGTHFFEGGAAYCATKAALKALTEVVILETRTQGIRTTLVSPGAICNRPKEDDADKIRPETIGRIVYDVARLSADALVGELEIRPSRSRAPLVSGIERLQYL